MTLRSSSDNSTLCVTTTLSTRSAATLNTALPPAHTNTESHERFVESSVPAAALVGCCGSPQRTSLHNNRYYDLENLRFSSVRNPAKILRTQLTHVFWIQVLNCFQPHLSTFGSKPYFSVITRTYHPGYVAPHRQEIKKKTLRRLQLETHRTRSS